MTCQRAMMGSGGWSIQAFSRFDIQQTAYKLHMTFFRLTKKGAGEAVLSARPLPTLR
jgi:hypothetical protein